MHCAVVVLALVLTCSAASAVEVGERTFVLKDHVGHRFTDELVHYELSLPPGQFWPRSVVLRNEAGGSVPVQFSNTKLHPDGSLASGSMWFLIDELSANGMRTYRLGGGEKDRTSTPPSDVSLVREQNSAVIATSGMAIRVLLGNAQFASPEAAEKLPAPIQGIRLRGGQWTGRGWMPAIQSVVYPGWGAFLRRGFNTPAESYVGIRFGDFTLDHTHNDTGSINWYARGVPMAMDFATMYTPHTPGAWLHSTLTYDHREHDKPAKCPGQGEPGCFYTGKSWHPHEFEPHTVLEPITDRASPNFTEVHGKITAFASQAGADYVRGEANRHWLERKPYYYRSEGSPSPWSSFTEWDKVQLKRPFRWVRQFAFVTDANPEVPSYLVINDDLSGNEELEPAFNFWCLAKDVAETGSRRFHFTGQHGMNLDMCVLTPSEGRVQTGEWGHRQNFLVGDPGMEENQTLVRVHGGRGGKGFAVVLYPRKSGEPEPKVETLAGGKLIRLSLPDQTHWVLLSREPVSVTDGTVKISGTAGVVKQWKDGRISLTLLAKGVAECDGLKLESAEPATRTR